MVLWLARVLLFLRVSTGLQTAIEYSSQKNVSCKTYYPNHKPEIALVQWYEN